MNKHTIDKAAKQGEKILNDLGISKNDVTDDKIKFTTDKSDKVIKGFVNFLDKIVAHAEKEAKNRIKNQPSKQEQLEKAAALFGEKAAFIKSILGSMQKLSSEDVKQIQEIVNKFVKGGLSLEEVRASLISIVGKVAMQNSDIGKALGGIMGGLGGTSTDIKIENNNNVDTNKFKRYVYVGIAVFALAIVSALVYIFYIESKKNENKKINELDESLMESSFVKNIFIKIKNKAKKLIKKVITYIKQLIKKNFVASVIAIKLLILKSLYILKLVKITRS